VIVKFLLALLIAYLGWRLWYGPPRRAKPVAPTGGSELAQARALLGVGADAGEAEIRAAHRRLVADAHPDRGGTDEAARRLNAARDLLLGARA
jgi:DnaJ homolog subfamily C member 19